MDDGTREHRVMVSSRTALTQGPSLSFWPSSASARAAKAVGWLTIVSTAVYFASDVIEATNGGFSNIQLWLTLAAESTLPVFVMGLYYLQRPQIGKLGGYGAVAYALAYVYFSYSVAYALTNSTPDFETLNRNLNPTMTIVGAVMLVAGIAFGVATYRTQVVPRWTGAALALGVILVTLSLGLAWPVELTAVAIRDAAFIGMGVAMLRGGQASARSAAIRAANGQPG